MSSDVKPTKDSPVKSVDLHVGEIVPGVPKKDPIIVADHVTRTFGGLTAVDVEHVEIPRNAITALIGPNGAGKTTFFNLLTGFDKPDTGKWTFMGKSLAGIPSFRVARLGQVRTFQLTKALSLLSVLDNMKLGAKGQKGENMFVALLPWLWRKQEEEIDAKAMDLLARFKIDTKAEDYAASLSGGQRKLLEMARALMSDPTLVMLDEPSAGLSPVRQDEAFLRVKEINKAGVTTIMVEQNARRCLQICDRGYVLDQGHDAYTGTGRELLNDPKVISLYLGTLGED